MLKTMIFVLLPLLLLGCAGSPSRVLLTKSDNLKDVSTFDLCKTYFLKPAARLKIELMERNAFTVEEWSFIDEQKIYIGMREVALVCAWGHPGLFGSVSESVAEEVVHKQWVYRACPGCRALYAYTENGKVASWQNIRAD